MRSASVGCGAGGGRSPGPIGKGGGGPPERGGKPGGGLLKSGSWKPPELAGAAGA